jgi:hypothetical protein
MLHASSWGVIMTSEYVFSVKFDGVSLPSTQRIPIPELQLTATLESGRITVAIEDIPEKQADRRAHEFVKKLYLRFLVLFGSRISKSEPPRLLSKTVTRGGVVSATGVVIPLPSLVAGTGMAISPLSQPELDALVADLQLRAITPEVPPSAPLYGAIEMFAAGIEAQNAAVRFVILYSALTLAALFKLNKGAQKRVQEEVDNLLLQANSAIATSPSPRKKTVQETLYTPRTGAGIRLRPLLLSKRTSPIFSGTRLLYFPNSENPHSLAAHLVTEKILKL